MIQLINGQTQNKTGFLAAKLYSLIFFPLPTLSISNFLETFPISLFFNYENNSNTQL